jgi:glycosyltransferase involved in cell wall biosynthesis
MSKKILLLEEAIYLPSFGGGNKANRLLLEEFAAAGYECTAVCRGLNEQNRLTTTEELVRELAEREVEINTDEPDVLRYNYRAVEVHAMNHKSTAEKRDYVSSHIATTQPDFILVSCEDRKYFLLEAAMAVLPERVVLLVQTVSLLPFGPLAMQTNARQTELFQRTGAAVSISRFAQDYLLEHARIESTLASFPVFGKGPFPRFSNFDKGFVTMINPCRKKGLDIFLAMAKAFPAQAFAVVPTWGWSEEVATLVGTVPNVTVLKAVDDIDIILEQTKILIAPSLWPETFGYVIPEAMLRGIPVLAADNGGISEAKLGVDYLLPVNGWQLIDGDDFFPEQDLDPWFDALNELLNSKEAYEECSTESTLKAHEFVNSISIEPFETIFAHLNTDLADSAL